MTSDVQRIGLGVVCKFRTSFDSCYPVIVQSNFLGQWQTSASFFRKRASLHPFFYDKFSIWQGCCKDAEVCTAGREIQYHGVIKGYDESEDL